MASEKTVNFRFGGLLPVGVFFVFLYLKLAEIGTVATWSWWWVTSPLWIPATIVFSIIIIVLFFVALFAFIGAFIPKKTSRFR